MEPIFRTYRAVVKSLPDDEIEGFFNVAEVDRYNEYLEPTAFLKHLDKFRRNNVVLWQHNYDQPPIGKVLDIHVTDNGLHGRVKLATRENPQARIIKDLIKGGFGPNSFSIGFLPHAYDEDFRLDTGQTVKRRYTEVELLELSLVNVPASPSSNITMRDYRGMEAGFTIKSTALPDGDGIPADELLDFLVKELKGGSVTKVEQTENQFQAALKDLLFRFLEKFDERITDRIDHARGLIRFPEG